MKIVGLVCAVALIAALTLLVVLQLSDGPAPEPTGISANEPATVAPTRPTEADPETADPALPAPPSDLPASAPPEELPAGVTPAEATAAKPEPAGTTWVIVGSVHAAELRLPGPIVITVAGVREGARAGEKVVDETTFDAAYTVDVTSILTAHDDLAELEVQFDHPRYKVLSLRVSIPESVKRPPQPRCTIAEMNVTLHPAGCLTGLVRDSQGSPVAEAFVAAFGVVDGRPGGKAATRTETDRNGRYRLRVGSANRYYVAALDRVERRPAGVFAMGALGRETHLPDLVLTPGATVEGTIRVLGDPVAKAAAAAELWSPVGKVSLRVSNVMGAHLFFWSDGALERALGRAVTDASGHYRIRGLGRVTYRIRPDRVPGLFPDVVRRLRDLPLVVPPAKGVDFNLGAVPVTVEVRSPQGPVGEAMVGLRGKSGSSSCSTGDSGRFRTLLAPRASYDLDVQAEGFISKRAQFETGEAGQAQTEVVVLEPRGEGAPGAVRVTVVTAGSPGPTRLPFQFTPLDGAGEKSRRMVAAENGAFLIDKVAPGRYRMTIAHRLSGSGSYYCEKTVEVEVVSERTTRLTIRLELGGRIRLAVRDGEGRFVSRDCRVVDRTGAPLKLWFRLLSRTGEWTANTGSTHSSGPSETFPPLAPGAYRVEFPDKAGVVEKAVTVRVKSGKTVDVVWKVE